MPTTVLYSCKNWINTTEPMRTQNWTKTDRLNKISSSKQLLAVGPFIEVLCLTYTFTSLATCHIIHSSGLVVNATLKK
jgi:hypothetical protein